MLHAAFASTEEPLHNSCLTRFLPDGGHAQAMRVLVVEEELRLAETIARGLRREGMAVDVSIDGADAINKSQIVRYDVIVLDRDLPSVHGDEVCGRVRADNPDAGIIMVTAAAELDDLVEGLGLGADDCL